MITQHVWPTCPTTSRFTISGQAFKIDFKGPWTAPDGTPTCGLSVVYIPSSLLISLLVMPWLPALHIVMALSSIFRNLNLLLFLILAIVSVCYILVLFFLLNHFNNGLLLIITPKSSYYHRYPINMTGFVEIDVFIEHSLIWSISNWPLKTIALPNFGSSRIVMLLISVAFVLRNLWILAIMVIRMSCPNFSHFRLALW